MSQRRRCLRILYQCKGKKGLNREWVSTTCGITTGRTKDFVIPQEQMDGDQQIHVAGLKTVETAVSLAEQPGSANHITEVQTNTAFLCSDELMESAIKFCKENRCQYSMHAMGGAAIDRIVNRVAKRRKVE